MIPGTVVRWRAHSNPAVILSGEVIGTRWGCLVVDQDPCDPFADVSLVSEEEVLPDAL